MLSVFGASAGAGAASGILFVQAAVNIRMRARDPSMNLSLLPRRRGAAWVALLAVLLAQHRVRAEWVRTDGTLAWRDGTNIVWQFSFDPKFGKPFFNPLTVAGGPALTHFRPEDHPWHYGLWFSWKYINHINYWEEDRATGRAEGATRWSIPKIEAQPSGDAIIQLELTYQNPSGRVDLTESRELRVSAPAADGSYAIDWRAHFTAGPAGAELDRTPMPGEPDGRVNGGYAGLGIRLASAPLTMSALCATGRVTRFQTDRARPTASAMACQFSDGPRDAGSVAIFSDPANLAVNTPWYLINSDSMRFACAAILAPKILTLPAGGRMNLHYRVVVRLKPWSPAELDAAQREWAGKSD
jgi:Family of unknown function (DUF6807)